MRKNIEISDEKINEFLEQFYSYFESGYAFEEFLKVYLEKIGLDEVVVTQRSSDGGIDLEAVRYGVGGFAGADAVDYFVQAKRNKPGTTIPIEKVRALRGVMPSGSKGIFITTASYSKKTEEFVDADPSRPIILIDGKSLVESCIDNEIGFVFTPVFSKNAMDALKDECDDLVKEDGTVVEENEGVKLVVDKQISANDIRARILRLPKAVSNLLPYDAHKVKVIFNGMAPKELTIAKNRGYLAGVTDLYKESGLIAEDGSYNPCKAIWKFSPRAVKDWVSPPNALPRPALLDCCISTTAIIAIDRTISTMLRIVFRVCIIYTSSPGILSHCTRRLLYHTRSKKSNTFAALCAFYQNGPPFCRITSLSGSCRSFPWVSPCPSGPAWWGQGRRACRRSGALSPFCRYPPVSPAPDW